MAVSLSVTSTDIHHAAALAPRIHDDQEEIRASTHAGTLQMRKRSRRDRGGEDEPQE